MKGFLVGISLLVFEYIAYHLAGWYLSTAKHLGANTFRPKDVMGPYFTCMGIAFMLWIFLVVWAIDSEKGKEKS